MMSKMYSIRDRKAQVYQTPFSALNIEVALRMLKASLQKTGLMSDYPDDFSLYEVGEFFDDSGMIKATEPTFIIEVKDLMDTPKMMENSGKPCG